MAWRRRNPKGSQDLAAGSPGSYAAGDPHAFRFRPSLAQNPGCAGPRDFYHGLLVPNSYSAFSNSLPYHHTNSAHAATAGSKNQRLLEKTDDTVMAIATICTMLLPKAPPIVKRQRVCSRG